MCTVLLPQGDNPIAINKYTITISYKIPIIRTLFIRITNCPHRLRPWVICPGFYKTKLPWNYRLSDQVQYSVTASRTANQARSKGLDAGTYCKL